MRSSDTNATAEFVGQVIDIFEDFLSDKNVQVDNPEWLDDPDHDPDDPVNIYGMDYGYLQTRLEDLLDNWNIKISF